MIPVSAVSYSTAVLVISQWSLLYFFTSVREVKSTAVFVYQVLSRYVLSHEECMHTTNGGWLYLHTGRHKMLASSGELLLLHTRAHVDSSVQKSVGWNHFTPYTRRESTINEKLHIYQVYCYPCQHPGEAMPTGRYSIPSRGILIKRIPGRTRAI